MILHGVLGLYTGAKAAFEDHGLEAEWRFGWRELGIRKVPKAGRWVVWLPGAPGGSAGEFGPPRNVGGTPPDMGPPRQLYTLRELATVYVYAEDPTAPSDEVASYRAARTIVDDVLAAIWEAGCGVTRVESPAWVTEKLELRRGACLRFTVAVEAPVDDFSDSEVVVRGVAGAVDVSLAGEVDRVEIEES